MFESERVRLRALHPDDLTLFAQWWNDPDIMRFQTGSIIRLNQETTNVSTIERWFPDDRPDVGFTITLKASSDVIGFVNLWGANVKNRSALLGIVLDKAYWNQGYGSEAMQIVLRYAFTEMNLHRIELHVFAFNERAVHVYRKLGFQEVGRLRETTFREGRWQDEIIMDLLQREYLANQGLG